MTLEVNGQMKVVESGSAEVESLDLLVADSVKLRALTSCLEE